MKTYAIAIVSICLLAAAAPAQLGYSESTEYRPRPVDSVTVSARTKDRKKADKKGEAAPVSGSTVTTDPPGGAHTGEITLTIPVLVLDRSGSVVNGLKKEEVSVFIDKTETPIVAFEQDKEPVTMVLVLDSSPSAASSRKTMQEQAAKFVDGLPANIKVMVIDFNTELRVRSEPTTDREATRKAIRKVDVGDGTAIYSAIQELFEAVLPRVAGRKAIVLMTDGVDTSSKKSDYAKSLTAVEKHDVPIYPIYFDTAKDLARSNNQTGALIARILGSSNISPLGTSSAEYKVGIMYLNDLAKASGGGAFASEKLVDASKSFPAELAGRYYVTVTVPRKNAGSRPVRVRINRPSLAVFARGSFVEK